MGDDMPFGRDHNNRFAGGFSPDEMRELREATDRIMRNIDSVRADVKADINRVQGELKTELAEVKAEVKITTQQMMPRAEYEARHRDIEKRIEDIEERSAGLEHRGDITFSKVVSIAALLVSTLSTVIYLLFNLSLHWK